MIYNLNLFVKQDIGYYNANIDEEIKEICSKKIQKSQRLMTDKQGEL